MIRKLAFITLGVLSLASPALAGPDGMWVNPGGGISGLRVEGEAVTPLKPGTHSLAEIVDGFQALCVETGFDKLRVGPAIIRSGWGGAYIPSMMSMKSGPVDLGGWQGESHALLVAKDVFFSPNPQCTLTVATATRYSAADLFPVLNRKYGEPANYSDLFDAAGKPNDRVRPFWIIGSDDGKEQVLFPRSLSRGTEYRIHLALVERVKTP